MNTSQQGSLRVILEARTTQPNVAYLEQLAFLYTATLISQMLCSILFLVTLENFIFRVGEERNNSLLWYNNTNILISVFPLNSVNNQYISFLLHVLSIVSNCISFFFLIPWFPVFNFLASSLLIYLKLLIILFLSWIFFPQGCRYVNLLILKFFYFFFQNICSSGLVHSTSIYRESFICQNSKAPLSSRIEKIWK